MGSACWLVMTLGLAGVPLAPQCHKPLPRWCHAPLAHWYQYRMGCGSACRHCQSTHRDWHGVEYDYHNRLDYPWFSLRRTGADVPEPLWPVERPLALPYRDEQPQSGRRPVPGPGPWGPWAPAFLYDPKVHVRY